MKRRIFWIVGPVLILAVLAVLLLKQMLPFGILFVETIDQSKEFTNYYGGDIMKENPPKIVVIVGPNDIDVKFSPDMKKRLESIDYERYFVVCVFQGVRGTSGYGVEIQYLLRQGNTIIIQAKFHHPKDQLTTQGFTSPYHIVQAPKGHLSGTYRFILRSETGETAEATHSIP